MKQILVATSFVFLSIASTTPTFASQPKIAQPAKSKTQACLARQDSIQNRMGSLTRFTEDMLATFDKITNRVKDFYVAKVLPAGGKVANYDQLVNDIQTKRAAAEVSLNGAKTAIDNFSCDLSTPRTVYNEFRLNMQAVKSALKNYRTSIKNLIIAVKGAIPEGSSLGND